MCLIQTWNFIKFVVFQLSKRTLLIQQSSKREHKERNKSLLSTGPKYSSGGKHCIILDDSQCIICKSDNLLTRMTHKFTISRKTEFTKSNSNVFTNREQCDGSYYEWISNESATIASLIPTSFQIVSVFIRYEIFYLLSKWIFSTVKLSNKLLQKYPWIKETMPSHINFDFVRKIFWTYFHSCLSFIP